MFNKRIVTMLLTFNLLAGFALAQSAAANGSLLDRLLQPELRQELALTPKQNAKLVKISEYEKNDLRLISQTRMISQEKRAQLIREAQEKASKRARAVLTAEQLAKLDAK